MGSKLKMVAKAPFSVQRAIELTLNMYELTVQLPDSGSTDKIMLKLTSEQQNLLDLIPKID